MEGFEQLQQNTALVSFTVKSGAIIRMEVAGNHRVNAWCGDSNIQHLPVTCDLDVVFEPVPAHASAFCSDRHTLPLTILTLPHPLLFRATCFHESKVQGK